MTFKKRAEAANAEVPGGRPAVDVEDDRVYDSIDIKPIKGAGKQE